MLSTFVSAQLSMLGLMILSLNTAVGMAGIFQLQLSAIFGHYCLSLCRLFAECLLDILKLLEIV